MAVRNGQSETLATLGTHKTRDEDKQNIKKKQSITQKSKEMSTTDPSMKLGVNPAALKE